MNYECFYENCDKMTTRKILVYFLIMLLTVYPVSAAQVALNRWVLNVTLHDDGVVEEVIQAEFDNSGSSPLEGFSFTSPVPGVEIEDNQSTGVTVSSEGGMSFNSPDVKQQTVSGKTNIIVTFDKPVEAGKKWNGRIGFKAANWAVKQDSNYSIDIPVNSPQAVASGKSADVSVPANADIRAQVFLPESVEVTSVTPKPFRILFQFDRMVPTWSPDKLHIGDTISIKSSYSSVLNKITGTDLKWRELKARINEAEKKGIDVSEAKNHLNNAEDNNTRLALQSYWAKDYTAALQYNAYANDELNLTENSLSGVAKENPQLIGTQPAETSKTPGFGALAAVFILTLAFMVIRRK
jgi:hypothetical protein